MTNRKLWLNLVLIVGIAGIITFSYLGSLPLFDPDEPVYAETAREMLQYQDFISPRIYGEFWYDKPPMYYWMVAGAFTIFGTGEFAARFPSALLAVAGIVLVYLSGRKLFTERAGLLAALILATSLEYLYLSKAAVTDMTLTFFLTAALLAFLHKRDYLFYGCAALAVVTKGPIGLLFSGAIISLYVVLTNNCALLWRMKMASGAAVFLLIALPWYLIMYHYHGMAFVETFFGFHNMTRFLQPEHPTAALWYYYIPVLIFGFFPWIAFLVQAVAAALKEKGDSRNNITFMVIWSSVVFIFFSVSQTKLVSYILPMYPPLALLVGWYIDKAWSENRYGVLTWAAISMSVVIAVLVAGLFYTGRMLTPQLMGPVAVTAITFILMLLFVWWMSYHRNFRGVITVNVVGMIVFTIILMTQIFPAVTQLFSMKGFVNEFKQHYDGNAPVYVAKFYRPGFMFYSGLPGAEIKPQEPLASVLDQNGKAYFIVRKTEYQKLSPSLQSRVQVLANQEDKILLARLE